MVLNQLQAPYVYLTHTLSRDRENASSEVIHCNELKSVRIQLLNQITNQLIKMRMFKI